MTEQVHRGVWVAAEPLDENVGAAGRSVLALDIPDGLFAEYEWVEESKGYREALVPAADLNQHHAALRLVKGEVDDDVKGEGK